MRDMYKDMYKDEPGPQKLLSAYIKIIRMGKNHREVRLKCGKYNVISYARYTRLLLDLFRLLAIVKFNNKNTNPSRNEEILFW